MAELNIGNRKLESSSYYLIENHNFWSEVFLSCNIRKANTIPTAGVYYDEKGMNLIYNENFVNNLTQEQVNFLLLHEVYHLVSNHIIRATKKGYDLKLSNIVQDMIINSDIKSRYVMEDPKFRKVDTPDGAYFIPEEYTGNHIFEELYDWMQDHPEAMPQPSKNGDPNAIGDGSGEPRYTFDDHILDKIPEDMRESFVEDVINRCKHRGTLSQDVEETIKKLKKPAQNNIRLVKSAVESLGCSKKFKTWQRFGRHHEMSRGNRKRKLGFNVLLDVSGSMHGSFEKALSQIFYNGYEINLIQVDTEVKCAERIKNKNQLQKLRIKGCGGTTLQPGINVIAEKYSKYNTIILTDGYTDTLDVSSLSKKVLILSVGEKCPVCGNDQRVKQIVLDR